MPDNPTLASLRDLYTELRTEEAWTAYIQQTLRSYASIRIIRQTPIDVTPMTPVSPIPEDTPMPSPKYQRRHYDDLAALLRRAYESVDTLQALQAIERLEWSLCHLFSVDNDAFREQTFVAACKPAKGCDPSLVAPVAVE